jgi:hypothetical protein
LRPKSPSEHCAFAVVPRKATRRAADLIIVLILFVRLFRKKEMKFTISKLKPLQFMGFGFCSFAGAQGKQTLLMF